MRAPSERQLSSSSPAAVLHSDAPARTNDRAVFGTITGSPGNTLCKTFTPKSQPAITAHPTRMAAAVNLGMCENIEGLAL
jgi:hypothetical protein